MVATWPNGVKTWTPLIDDPTNTNKDPQALASSGHLQEIRDEVSAIQDSLSNNTKYSVVLHEQKADPHPQYLTQAEGDARYAATGATGFLTQTQGDARYVLQGTDPLPQYLTQTEGDARYLQTANAFTQALADARYPQKGDLDPYPQYLTPAEGDARYPLSGAADPYAQYLTQARGDVRYMLSAATHTRSIRIPFLYPSGTLPLIIPLWQLTDTITVTGVVAYRSDGDPVTINVRKRTTGNVSTNLLSADYSVATTGAWVSATSTLVAAPATTLAATDSLEAMLQSMGTNPPTLVVVQVNYTENVK